MPPVKSGSGGSSDLRRRQDGDETPTNTLWVGNLSADAGDDIMGVFSKHGALDCVTMRASRTYAFVLFRHVDDARAAKDALQGTPIRGNPARIEFSRPAKAVRHLWIGGVSSSVTKEQLENEFLKFGKIEEYQFFRDRNSALIDFCKMEDAINAHKTLNGKHLGGEQLCVDFQRSQPPRRDLLDYNLRNGLAANRGLGPIGHATPPDGVRGFHDSSRNMSHGGRREGHPSSVLWVGYPPSVQIDEEMLHNAMILFGEIERIKCFPSRHYSFVEFRSIDEARRAKEGLQGRLFNDPRIQILFSSSGLASNKDNPPPFSGIRGPRTEMFSSGCSFGPLDLHHSSHPLSPDNFPGFLTSNDMPAPNMLMRPFGPQGFDPHEGGPEYHDFGGIFHDFPDPNADKSNRTWQQRSPSAPGILPSPQGLRPPVRSMPGAWDDMRETKRFRMDGSSFDDTPFNERLDHGNFGDPVGFSHPDRVVSALRRFSPVVQGQGEIRQSPDIDHCWRGIIAKGGTHVCRARCVPIGKGIDLPLSEVVNCSARTGLDMLTKHYAEADGFDIVFFLPDSEEDFASYTEFLRYLGLKSRAGVAKLDDGTTLFLVPPSDFLTEVLKITGPERLYGVVLNLPQQSTSAAMQRPQLALPPTSHYNELQDAPSSQKGHNFVSYNEERPLKFDYNRPLPEEPLHCTEMGRQWNTRADEARVTQSVPLDHTNNQAAASQVDVSLTPELISTLASLIPRSIQSSATGLVQMPSSSAGRATSSSTSVMHDGSVQFQGWSQQHQVKVSGTFPEQLSNPPEHLAQQFINQASGVSHFPTYLNISSRQDQYTQPIGSGGQIQNSALNSGQHLGISSGTLNVPVLPYQGGQFSANPSNQQYQHNSSLAFQNNYGILQATNAAGVFNPSVQQQLNSAPQSAHDQIGNLPQHENLMALQTNKVNTEFISQGQELQSILSGSTQGNSENDADKNQRYQSTLQFAANLLLQMQQQQQVNTKSAQGSGKQQ